MTWLGRRTERAAAAAVVATASVAIACAVGQGNGHVTGSFVIPLCGKDLSSYDMQPNFFAADPAISAHSTDAQLVIRVQNGGGTAEYADALFIAVQDTDAVNAAIQADTTDATPSATFDIELERPPGSPVGLPAPPVRMSLSLQGTCGSGLFDPGNAGGTALNAVSGKITFTSILHGPLDSRDTNAKRITGSFNNVVLEDPRTPGQGDSGTISGDFDFFFQFGGPAQAFP
ncbi:MAG: hypothetical protein ACHREM_30280 [Polyangiales bacterium]